MTIHVGERLPNATLRLLTPDGPKPVETKDYFGGKTVVLFGLPGAFTPTCHKNHLPGFIANEARFKAKGVDKIAMTAVNDHYVLCAWAEATGADGPRRFSRRWRRRLRQGARPRHRPLCRRPGQALEALLHAGRGRRGEGAQHRAGARQGRRLGRRASAGADEIGRVQSFPSCAGEGGAQRRMGCGKQDASPKVRADGSAIRLPPGRSGPHPIPAFGHLPQLRWGR